MTQIFNDEGVLVPVTVLQAGPCVVTQVKTEENDGYKAVQVGFVDEERETCKQAGKGVTSTRLAYLTRDSLESSVLRILKSIT